MSERLEFFLEYLAYALGLLIGIVLAAWFASVFIPDLEILFWMTGAVLEFALGVIYIVVEITTR